MNFAGRIGLIAGLAVAASAFGEESLSTGAQVRDVVARAETSGARPGVVTQAIGLDELVGRYDTEAGAVLFVGREGDSLTIEPSAGAAPLSLERLDARAFASAHRGVRLTFDVDGFGRVTGLALAGPAAQAMVATRAALPHGIVTIEDLPRGIVTIHDVWEDVASL
jgi:hypothetical protein